MAILNERSDPSQSSNDAPHRLPSTLRATGHEPPQFGLSLPKHDAEPSEQPLCHYKGALSGLGPRDGLALRWSAACNDKAGHPDQHGINTTNKTMRPSRRERRDRRAKQPKEEERPVSGWVRPPDSTDKERQIAAQKKLNMGFDCRAGYGRRRDQTDLRAIEAREQARYEALARRKEREAQPKKPIQKRLRPLLRGCKPERVRIGKRPVNFPPKSKTDTRLYTAASTICL